VSTRGSEQSGSDPGALFWESLRLVGGLAAGLTVMFVAQGLGFDPETMLLAQVSGGPIIMAVTGLVYWMTCADSAGPEYGARPDDPLAWPENPRSLKDTVVAVAGGTLAIVIGSVVITKLIELTGLTVDEQKSIVELTSPVDGSINPALYTLAPMALIAAPLLEEFVFRGLYFRRLLGKVGLVPALVSSAVAFAGIHGNASGLPVYLLQAVIFAGVYRYTGRLSAAIGVHFLNNLITLAVLASGIAN
jgi:membrane protease YdiL (CAAX protease family)